MIMVFIKKKCERCGSCCVQLKGIINISGEDIKRWIKDGRMDILQYCAGWSNGCLTLSKKRLERHLNGSVNMEMWFDPENGNDIFLCPFLRKKPADEQFECMIQDTKPEICRDYICDPKDMRQIIKKPFEENLKYYEKERKHYHTFINTPPKKQVDVQNNGINCSTIE